MRNFVPDLRVTISNTENYIWREDMKKDEALLKSLIGRLEQAAVG